MSTVREMTEKTIIDQILEMPLESVVVVNVGSVVTTILRIGNDGWLTSGRHTEGGHRNGYLDRDTIREVVSYLQAPRVDSSRRNQAVTFYFVEIP